MDRFTALELVKNMLDTLPEDQKHYFADVWGELTDDELFGSIGVDVNELTDALYKYENIYGLGENSFYDFQDSIYNEYDTRANLTTENLKILLEALDLLTEEERSLLDYYLRKKSSVNTYSLATCIKDTMDGMQYER